LKNRLVVFSFPSSSSMRPPHPKTPLDEWIANEAITLATAPEGSFSLAVDRVVADCGEAVALLGFGEALHGGEEILRLRNRLFRHLVEKHGYAAIAIESSFPRSRLVDEYVHGRGPATYDELQQTGFGHGMGQLEANRDLVEWMRAYNLDPRHSVKLRFYGFDIPSGTMGIASPRAVLGFVIDYLAAIDPALAEFHREKIHKLLGDDMPWENPAVYMDPTKSIALSPAATALRVETEDLIAELRSRRPELVAGSSEDAYREALHYGEIARQLLNFHAAMGARKPGQSPALVLGTRDASMADNLTYVVTRERKRGKVLVFAHNTHLQRGRAVWPGQKYWGTDDDCEWWPAGAHLAGILGPRYAVIGTAVGISRENGIGLPEAATLEAKLEPLARTAVLLPTRDGDFRGVPSRSGSIKNPTYVPLNAEIATNFDWILHVAETAYNRGGPSLDTWDAKPSQDHR
jgi:erythromycin esterase-like protein